jgi:TolB-like protein/DNA-binding winged helix-turn-helix (wHTH) protein/cytochrome c-type biogenesis protein CcmH/NrfG
MSTQSPARYEFGPFVLDPGRRLLFRDGEPVPLAPRVFETLLVLVTERDRVLTKDELLTRIWGDTVVEEGGLARNISILRKTLGERPDDHQYVVTVPARGYRFVAQVRERREDLPLPQAAGMSEPAALDTKPRHRAWLARWRVAAAAAFVVALAAALVRPLLVADARAPMTALAVLPLENLSGDPGQEYFADGVTDALIGTIGRIRTLRVVSRTSVMRFKGARSSVGDIARALDVDAILEGSIRRTGNRVQISLQLVHASSDTQLWTRDYERRLTDVLTLQNEVARAVAQEIQVRLTAEEKARLASDRIVDPDAYLEYLLGQHYLWRPNEDDLALAVAHFERATQLDPDYAPAYAGLSHAWWWRGIWGTPTSKQVKASARAAAERALALDPGVAEAHVSAGRLKFNYDWDWKGAERDFGRALEIDPNNLDAHFFHGMLFMALGRFDESIAHMRRAAELDPLSATVQSALGRILYRARRFEEAIPHLNQAIALEPEGRGAHERLADVYEALGRYDEALAMLDKAGEAHQPQARAAGTARRARLFALMGKRAEAKRLLDDPSMSNSALIKVAAAYAALGDADEAFRRLFKLAEEGDSLNYVKTDPTLDGLHDDPRWPQLLRRMNLPLDSEHAPAAGTR